MNHPILMEFSRFTKLAHMAAGAIMVVVGVAVFAIGGIRGFNGQGGSDTLVLQILSAGCFALILSGAAAIYSGVRSSLGVGIGSLVSGILSGIILVLVTAYIPGTAVIAVSLLLYILRWRDHGKEE
jgi:hypothetical protein